MKVRELITVFGIKPDQQGVNQVNAGLSSMMGMAKQAITAFAAFAAVRWVERVVEQVADTGRAFGKMSARTGIAVDELQKLGYAAKLSGAETEDLAIGLRKLQMSQVDAAKGSAGAVDKFKSLGVSVKNADGSLKATPDLMYEVADGIAALKTDAEKTSAVIDIFGRGGAALIPLFKKGSTEIKAMSNELEEFGALMSDDLIAASRNLGKQQKRLDTAFLGVKISIAKALIPAIAKFKESLIGWWKVNGQLIRQRVESVFSKVAESVGRLGRSFMGALKWTFDFFKNMSALPKKILLVGGVLLMLMKLMKMGPVGKFLIVLAALVMLLEDFQTWLEGGESVLGRVLAKLKEWTGLDFDKGLRRFVVALKELSESPKPFDWAAYWQEVTAVTTQYLDAAAITRGKWFDDIVKGVTTWAAQNPITQFLLNLEIVWFRVVKNLLSQFNSFRTFIIDIFTVGIDKAFSDLAARIKDFFAPVINMFKWLLDKIPIFHKLMGEEEGPKKEERKKTLSGAKQLITPSMSYAAPYVSSSPVLPSGQQATANAYYGGTSVNAPFTANIEVKAAPGMNEKDLANQVVKVVKEHQARQNRLTMKAMTPAKATP